MITLTAAGFFLILLLIVAWRSGAWGACLIAAICGAAIGGLFATLGGVATGIGAAIAQVANTLGGSL